MLIHTENRLIPKRMFFTKGVGTHKTKLQSFEMALRKAGVATCNLVSVSSIFPPHCRIIPRQTGQKALVPGEITFTVMARAETNEPSRLIGAAIGMAIPKEKKKYGYLSECHEYGVTARKLADESEDLAATMLATTLGIRFDPDEAWDQRKQLYKARKDLQFITRSITQTAEGNKDGMWTTVVAMAVFLLDM